MPILGSVASSPRRLVASSHHRIKSSHRIGVVAGAERGARRAGAQAADLGGGGAGPRRRRDRRALRRRGRRARGGADAPRRPRAVHARGAHGAPHTFGIPFGMPTHACVHAPGPSPVDACFDHIIAVSSHGGSRCSSCCCATARGACAGRRCTPSASSRSSAQRAATRRPSRATPGRSSRCCTTPTRCFDPSSYWVVHPPTPPTPTHPLGAYAALSPPRALAASSLVYTTGRARRGHQDHRQAAPRRRGARPV